MAQQTKAIRSRRRGDEFEDALYEAILAELTAVGYGRLTMKGVAARARTGKAALYRRWASKHDLVRAALHYASPPLPELRADRSARENLLTVLTSHRDLLAGKTAFPSLAIIGELFHEPDLRAIWADAVLTPRLQLIETILRTGVSNGEIDPETLTPFTCRVGPALVNQYLQLTGAPPTGRQLAVIADTVISHPTRK